MMSHGDARGGKWRGNWRMEWVASTLHTILEHGVSSITTADAHTSAASSQLNWRSWRFIWTLPSRRKTKYGFCACAIIFQTQSVYLNFSRACLYQYHYCINGVGSRFRRNVNAYLLQYRVSHSRRQMFLYKFFSALRHWHQAICVHLVLNHSQIITHVGY
jgi:hypothetical protein